MPLKKPIILVSDHAVLRYIQRAMDLDVEQVREHIRQLVAPFVDAKATNVTVNGLSYRFGESKPGHVTVTTVLLPEMAATTKPRPLRRRDTKTVDGGNPPP